MMKIGRQTSHGAEMKIDLKNTEWVTDMYWKIEGTQSFEDFIQLAVTQMTPRRRYGYDIRVVGVQLVSGEIFEIGRDYEIEMYFFNSTPTSFGQQYGELFMGTGMNGNLVGAWIGFHVLNQAILRVICKPNPSEWA
nr:hypothetical protein [Tanacetum cinerariifolium]